MSITRLVVLAALLSVNLYFVTKGDSGGQIDPNGRSIVDPLGGASAQSNGGGDKGLGVDPNG